MGIGLLVSCDSSVSTNRPLAEKTASPDSATLAHAHMPTGASLPAPGAGPRGTLRSYRAAKGRKNKSGPAESPYGCYLASRPYSEDVRFRSVYLYFPKELVEASKEKTERLIYRLGTYTRGEADTTGVRYAHCVIPRSEGARSLARKQIIRRGEEKALQESKANADAKTWMDCEVRESIICLGSTCWVDDRWYDCSSPGGGDPGGGGEDDPYPDYDGGGGSGDDDSGDDSGEQCSSRNPDPGSNCEPKRRTVNERELCSSDPLKDMDIRATCDGVEGGRFGENARGPGDAHYGIDLLAEVGTPAWALESGRVYGVNRDKEESDFGKYVIIQSDGKLIMYAHLSKVSVRGGDDVTMRKTKIGETGVTGNACRSSCSCGPAHLHLGVKEGSTWGSGTPIDPEKGTLGTEFSSNGDPISDNCG